MRRVMGVDEDRLGLPVIVVLVVVLLGFPGNVRCGQGRVLTSGGDVVSLEDPADIKYQVLDEAVKLLVFCLMKLTHKYLQIKLNYT